MYKWRDKKGGIRKEKTEYEIEREKKTEWRNMWRYRKGVRYREMQFLINFSVVRREREREREREGERE